MTSKDINRDLEQSRSLIERALAFDAQDAEPYHGLAILELLAHQHERALRAAQRAIELNENFHPGFFALGETRIFMGDFAEGLEPVAHCLRLSPTDPFSSVFVSLLALAHYHLQTTRRRCGAQRKHCGGVAPMLLSAPRGGRQSWASLSGVTRLKLC